MLRSAASTPTTSAPRRAIGSASRPPPQPMSSRRRPSNGRRATIAAELGGDLVHDVVEPARVQHVQRLELAVRVPPLGGHRLELRDLGGSTVLVASLISGTCVILSMSDTSWPHEGKPHQPAPRPDGLYPPPDRAVPPAGDGDAGSAPGLCRAMRPAGRGPGRRAAGGRGAAAPGNAAILRPEHYRVDPLRPAGCGRSHAQRFGGDQHHLGPRGRNRAASGRRARIDAGLCWAASWARASALVYAETHPERVRALVLRGVFTMTEAELAWFYGGGAGRSGRSRGGPSNMIPAESGTIRSCAPPQAPVRAGPVEQTRYRARLGGWESHSPSSIRARRGAIRRAPIRSAFARLENHYFTMAAASTATATSLPTCTDRARAGAYRAGALRR